MIYNSCELELVICFPSLIFQIADHLNNLIQIASEIEIAMNSVERIKYYTYIGNENYEGTWIIWPYRYKLSFCFC